MLEILLKCIENECKTVPSLIVAYEVGESVFSKDLCFENPSIVSEFRAMSTSLNQQSNVNILHLKWTTIYIVSDQVTLALVPVETCISLD